LKEVLDSKFFIVHYSSKDEAVLAKTSEKLAKLRREKRGIVPAIVVAETTNLVCREGGREKALAHVRTLEHSGLEVIPMDMSLARDAGMLKCMHRDVPMADCIIAATAIREKGAVVSDDEHFRRIKKLPVVWI
jgi:predicted nucleic acid-binding protein